MTIASEISDDLNQAGIQNLGQAFPFRIPPSSLVKYQDKALIAISEVLENPTEHGSNIYNETLVQIQVKICYPIGDIVNTDAFEQSIVSFFIKNNWLRQANNGHYIDESGHAEIDLFFKRRI